MCRSDVTVYAGNSRTQESQRLKSHALKNHKSMRLLVCVAVLLQPTLQSKIGGCINTAALANVPDDPYTVSEITPGNSCAPFSKTVRAYGLLFAAGTQGQNVPDNGLKWLAKATSELFPTTASDQATQKEVLQNMFKYAAAIPVFVGSFVDNMEPAKDVLSMCDTITIQQAEGPDGLEGKKAQIIEVYEHLLHIITDVGFSKTWPSKWGISESSELHSAMTEAVDKKVFSISSYTKIDAEARLRIQLQEFAYWALSTVQGVHGSYFHDAPGSTNGEWTLLTKAEVQSKLPLFWALHSATSATVLGEISTDTMTALGELSKAGTPKTATWPIVDGGRGKLPSSGPLENPCGGGSAGGGGDTVTIALGVGIGVVVLVGLGLGWWLWTKRSVAKATSSSTQASYDNAAAVPSHNGV